MVRERLAVLSPRSEGVLRAAAVAGLEFDPRVVATASGVSADEAAEAFARAQRSGLLVPATRDPRWLAFRHALVRSVLLDALDTPVRSELHRRIGLALEPDADHDPAALVGAAHHFGSATVLGEWRRAVRYGLPVAEAAFDAGVYEDVITVAGRALAALGAAGDPEPGVRLDLEILHGGAQRAVGAATGYQALLATFADARRRGDATRMADAALAFTVEGAASEEAFIDDSLLEVYEEALAALRDEDRRRRALLLGHLASAHAWRRSGRTARRLADDALAIARDRGDRAVLARVLTTTRRSMTGLGMLDQQERMEAEMFALAEHFGDPGQHVRAALWRFETLIDRGQGDRLESLIDSAAGTIAALRGGNYHHSLAYSQASLALLRGDVTRADDLVQRAGAIGLERGIDATVVEAIILIQLIGVRLEQNRLHELRDRVAGFYGTAGVSPWLGIVGLVDAELGRVDGVAGLGKRPSQPAHRPAMDVCLPPPTRAAAPIGSRTENGPGRGHPLQETCRGPASDDGRRWDGLA
jgi:hypothetical protein